MSCSKKGPNSFMSPRGKPRTRKQAQAAKRMTGRNNPNSRASRTSRERRGRR